MRRLLIPEVVQTSSIDCGPACLSALLRGFGLYASYGRLREACQTGIDGTSIDVLEQLANQTGLEAEQIVIPADHFALPQSAALPAITVVRQPSGMTHFVVVWRRHGRRFQIMDPATGRRWTKTGEFAKELYIHQMIVPGSGWREFAESKEFMTALKARIRALGLESYEARQMIARALTEPEWLPIATLDAAVRMATPMVRSRAFSAPWQISDFLANVVSQTLKGARDNYRIIPAQYWSVHSVGSDENVAVTGVVLVRAKGRKQGAIDRTAMAPEVAAAVSEKPPRPVAALWRLLKCDGALRPAMIVAALLSSSVGVVLQALLLRVLIEGGRGLTERGQRLGAVAAVLGLMLILLAIDVPAVAALVAMGRRLEVRFRMAFLEKLPRIADQYFQSRPASDMAARSHSIHNIRALPGLAGQLLHSVFELAVTTGAIIWIDPRLWVVATLSGLVAIGLPLVVQPLLGERELRVRTHAGSLSRFYLDSLLGLIAIRTHGGEGVLRDEHQNLLAKWTSANMALQRVSIRMEGIQLAAGYGLAALLIVLHLSRFPESPALLLLAYWSLNIPVLGKEIATQAGTYPSHRNIILRMLEPLNAMEGRQNHRGIESGSEPAIDSEGAAAVQMKDVSVVAGGHQILNNITLDVRPGSHVAILGASGAGKSSLVHLLLGLQTPASGLLHVDQFPLEGEHLERLRRQTAWIAPAVHLWNRSLAENLRYGLNGDLSMMLGDAVEGADLTAVLEKLSDGLQTRLGECGALLSGGEGQRVRIGRALLRPHVRLVILDEPFRGLEADARRSQLREVRRIWRDATVLFVTHDVADTKDFDRVLVMERGAIVEDGDPMELTRAVSSRYSALLFREIEFKRSLLYHPLWRRLTMRQGVLEESAEASSVAASGASVRETSA